MERETIKRNGNEQDSNGRCYHNFDDRHSVSMRHEFKSKDAANSRLIRLYRVLRQGGQNNRVSLFEDRAGGLVWQNEKYGRYPKLNYVGFVLRKLGKVQFVINLQIHPKNTLKIRPGHTNSQNFSHSAYLAISPCSLSPS